MTLLRASARFTPFLLEEMVNCTTVSLYKTLHHRAPLVGIISVMGLLLLPVFGCGVKTPVKVAVSPRVAAARTATLQELVSSLQQFDSRVRSLKSASVKVTLTTRKGDSGIWEKYKRADAYILLQRPDDLLLTVQDPILKTTLLQLASYGDEFEMYNPGDRKLYVGDNRAREFQVEDDGNAVTITARPKHIFDAILPPALPLGTPGIRISRTEWQDPDAKYYILTILQESGGDEMRMLRQIWIERSQLAVAREITFSDSGELAGIVDYGDLSEFGGVLLPRTVRIDRPVDGYSLDIAIGSWSVNPEIDDAIFTLRVPDDTKRIMLKAKGGAGY